MLKNGKDLSNGASKIKLWNHTKYAFPVFAKNFHRPWMKLKIFFCHFLNPWTLRVSWMGCYTSKCLKKSKSLHPNVHVTFSETGPCFNPILLASTLVSCHKQDATVPSLTPIKMPPHPQVGCSTCTYCLCSRGRGHTE
jgi:hypothetical protein